MNHRRRIPDFQDRLAEEVIRANLGATPLAPAQLNMLQYLQRHYGFPPAETDAEPFDSGPGSPYSRPRVD